MLAVNIANGLAEEGIKSFLCVTRKEGSLNDNLDKNVGYLYLKRVRTLDVQAIFRLKEYIIKNKINIIHAHSTSSFLAFCVKLIYPKVKIVWHDHFGNSDFLNQRKIYPISIFSYFFETIIVVNKKLQLWAKEKLHSKNVYFVHNFAFFKNDSKITVLKGIENKRIVHLASFTEQKDHLNLLEAFKIIVKEFPEWTLHLIGKDYRDSYSELINNFIIKEKLDKNIFLYGSCTDIKHILSQTTIGVLSSKSEGLPVALLEYGLAKLPVVCTTVGECSSVITNSESGFLSPPKNHRKLAVYLSKLMASENLQNKFSLNLSTNLDKYFSKKSTLDLIIKLYNKCL